ncbi:MAG: hypothetical protein C5S48_00010 [Candidatus Methanogaster sp.]|nr:MAG: hypothetical protein C5S48_00010 [ANME-2 cluster archaeon]
MGASVTDASTVEALTENILWQIQNEGLATYVAYRARPKGLVVEDYRILDNSLEVHACFEMLQLLLADIARMNSNNISDLRKRIWTEGIKSRAFYVAGASMARRIEEYKGRNALIKTVESGPQSFFLKYTATSPPKGLHIELS